MTTTAPEPPFPCPFCQSERVVLVGSGLVFLHYKCSKCAEVWTAMAAARPSILRPAFAKATADKPAFGKEGKTALDLFEESFAEASFGEATERKPASLRSVEDFWKRGKNTGSFDEFVRVPGTKFWRN